MAISSVLKTPGFTDIQRQILAKNGIKCYIIENQTARKVVMSIRGELFTTQVVLDKRAYFFNVKENRNGDVFVQVVESKSNNGEEFDRHAIVVFEEDMQKFCKGFEETLAFIEKDKKNKAKAKVAKETVNKRKVYKKSEREQKPLEPRVKKTGRVHVVSKLSEQKDKK